MGNFLMGLGLGMFAGVLLAPRSGSDMRGLIGSKASEGLDYVKRHTNELKETAIDAVEKGKDVVNRQVEKIASSQEHASQVYQR